MKLSEAETTFLEDQAAIADNPNDLLSLINKAISCDKYHVDNPIMPSLKSQKEMLQTIIALPDFLDQKKQLLEDVAQCIASNLMMLSEASMKGQGWYLKSMKAVGYSLKDGGHCFGMAHMAMQAFLVDEEMTEFDKRLRLIERLPLSDVENNFSKLKSSQQALLEKGEIEIAENINSSITNIQAFFDGIALYQSTSTYTHLFETSVKHQDAEKTMAITHPVLMDLEEESPTLVSCDSGAYNQSELETYLELLEKHLGDNSFALELISARHAINLNYSEKNKCWLLLDPNNLPAVKYKDTGLLAKALMQGYKQKKGLVMETSLYTKKKHAENMGKNRSSMKETPEYQKLHDSAKLNTVFEDNISQLEYATKRNDIVWIQENIELLDLNQADLTGYTPLMAAAENGALDAVKVLTAQGANINQTNKNGISALMKAASYKHYNIVGQLLEAGANIDAQNVDGHSALTRACINEDIPTAVFLIEKGADVNKRNIDDDATLDIALIKCCSDVISMLLQHGAKPTEKMLSNACLLREAEVVTTLIEHGGRYGVKPTEEMLSNACVLGRAGVVTTLIDHGVKPTEKMLLKACVEGNSEVVTTLIEYDVKPTEEMFLLASMKGNRDVITTLIEHGIKPTQEMLLSACFQGQVTVVTTLIEHGAKPTEKMLLFASMEGNAAVVTTLIEHGIKPTEEMLFRACTNGKIEVINALMTGPNGLSPQKEFLYEACLNNNDGDVIKALIKNLHKPEELIKSAYDDNRNDIARVLISNNVVPVEMVEEACFTGNVDIIKMLIDDGVKPTAQMLETAYKQNKIDIFKALVTQPGNENVKLVTSLIDSLFHEESKELKSKLKDELKMSDDDIEEILNEVKSNILLELTSEKIILLCEKRLNVIIFDKLSEILEKKRFVNESLQHSYIWKSHLNAGGRSHRPPTNSSKFDDVKEQYQRVQGDCLKIEAANPVTLKTLLLAFSESSQIKLVIEGLRKNELCYDMLPTHLQKNKEIIIAAKYPYLDYVLQYPETSSASLGLITAAVLEVTTQSFQQAAIIAAGTTTALAAYSSMKFFTPNLSSPSSQSEHSNSSTQTIQPRKDPR